MPSPTTQPAKKPGVSSLWRTATVCLIAGMGVRWWIAREPAKPSDHGLTVRGDPLPDDNEYDPRLDQKLDRVDMDAVPFPQAFVAIAKQAKIQLVESSDITNPGGYADPPAPPLVTLHLRNVATADAFNAVFASQGSTENVRESWCTSNGILYTVPAVGQPTLYTRVYDVKRILDEHAKRLDPTTPPTFRAGGVDYDMRDGWLLALLAKHVSVDSFGVTWDASQSRASLVQNMAVVTATAGQHRVIEQMLSSIEHQSESAGRN